MKCFLTTVIAASVMVGTTSAYGSHTTYFGAVDAIDHTFPTGGGVAVATPSSASDDSWLRFTATAGDNLVIEGTADNFMNMVLFREVTNGIVEIGDLADVDDFNVDQTGNGVDLVVQHPGFNGIGTDQYVVPGIINFSVLASGQYVIGLSPANEDPAFVQTTTVTLSGNTASIPEPTTLALAALGLLSLCCRRKRA